MMKRRISGRNIHPDGTSRLSWGSRDALLARVGWFLDPRKLPRFSRVLPSPLDRAPDRQPWKRLPAWWAHGAFRNKGRHYGAQYLAGRRAPPLLPNQ